MTRSAPMTDDAATTFLFHHTPPLGIEMSPILLSSSQTGNVEVIDFERLSKTKTPVVTHSFGLLVEWFRNKSLPLPQIVIDLEIAKKLIVGRPKSDYGFETPW